MPRGRKKKTPAEVMDTAKKKRKTLCKNCKKTTCKKGDDCDFTLSTSWLPRNRTMSNLPPVGDYNLRPERAALAQYGTTIEEQKAMFEVYERNLRNKKAKKSVPKTETFMSTSVTPASNNLTELSIIPANTTIESTVTPACHEPKTNIGLLCGNPLGREKSEILQSISEKQEIKTVGENPYDFEASEEHQKETEIKCTSYIEEIRKKEIEENERRSKASRKVFAKRKRQTEVTPEKTPWNLSIENFSKQEFVKVPIEPGTTIGVLQGNYNICVGDAYQYNTSTAIATPSASNYDEWYRSATYGNFTNVNETMEQFQQETYLLQNQSNVQREEPWNEIGSYEEINELLTNITAETNVEFPISTAPQMVSREDNGQLQSNGDGELNQERPRSTNGMNYLIPNLEELCDDDELIKSLQEQISPDANERTGHMYLTDYDRFPSLSPLNEFQNEELDTEGSNFPID